MVVRARDLAERSEAPVVLKRTDGLHVNVAKVLAGREQNVGAHVLVCDRVVRRSECALSGEDVPLAVARAKVHRLVPEITAFRRVGGELERVVHMVPVVILHAALCVDRLDPLGVAVDDAPVGVVPLFADGANPEDAVFNRSPFQLARLGLCAVAVSDGPALEHLGVLARRGVVGVNLEDEAGVVAHGEEAVLEAHKFAELHGAVAFGGLALQGEGPAPFEAIELVGRPAAVFLPDGT
mmetsp:Transcript_6471/g.16503  ORF Transcript_6471/g.16503 Transcript_6471/m.16503 type:complete len:238 (-) Transcript_6471:163-876(-)